MNITVLGAGSMGCLFAAFLARSHDVTLIARLPEAAGVLNAGGITVREPDGSSFSVSVKACLPEEAPPAPDLILVFTKGYQSETALNGIRHCIGSKTRLLSLQNGMGHEAVLERFAPPENVLIGATQHNASTASVGTVRHGGIGYTRIGGICPEGAAAAAEAAAALTAGGIPAEAVEDVRRTQWDKLFLNASASALTGLLQCPMGTVADDPHAWAACAGLIDEAVAVACADGYGFDAGQVREAIRAHLEHSRGGYTSIYADLKAGRPTEVDTITGAVASAAKRLGIHAPRAEQLVQLIHAAEHTESQKKENE